MRKQIINIYNVEELNKKAKEKAYYNFCKDTEYPYTNENIKVLNAFANIFNVKIDGWNYDEINGNVDYWIDCKEEISEMQGIRLLKYIWNTYSDDIFQGKFYSTKGYYDKNNKYHYKYRHSKVILDNNCVLTGYYLDNEILQPIYNFLNKPNNMNFKELISECLNNWSKACMIDYKNYYSIDNFIAESNDNEREYTKDGELYIA
ncbi:MAG: hypothetical protein LIR50_12795 [Bacillota bacterium]|nr:hypothetical protein [Bacillota bacterium]